MFKKQENSDIKNMIAKARNLLKGLENKVKEIFQKVTRSQEERKLKKKVEKHINLIQMYNPSSRSSKKRKIEG